MFGLSKHERAKKALNSALKFILVGRRDDRERIMAEMSGEIEAISHTITGETATYKAAVQFVRQYILAKLEKLSVDERVDLLERIAARQLGSPPEIIRLIAHAAYCIAILEEDSKSTIENGTTDTFLSKISAWFTDDEQLQRRVLRYLYKCTENHHAYLQQLKRENEERLGYKPKSNGGT